MSVSLKPLADQVILITGASSGIGLATARAAAKAGAAVVLVARNRPALEEAVRAIETEGGRAAFAEADVGDAATLRAAAELAVSRFGRIDTFVANAGVAIFGKVLDTPADEHERLFRTNYWGAVNSALIAVDHLRAKGGALIVVGSIGSDLSTPLLGPYSASKHAVKAYVDALRAEIGADRLPISVTLVKPAGIDTPIGQHSADHLPIEAMLPPPVYDPALVARAILHAAEHPRRQIYVGGAGVAQVLVGTHFPKLLDALTRVALPMLFRLKTPKTAGNTLFASAEAGRAHSGVRHPRRTSLYTNATLHPGRTALGLGLVAGAAGLWLARRRRRPSPS